MPNSGDSAPFTAVKFPSRRKRFRTRAAAAQAATEGWDLTFSDEFEGPAKTFPDAKKWNIEVNGNPPKAVRDRAPDPAALSPDPRPLPEAPAVL